MTTSGVAHRQWAGGEIPLGADMENRYEKLASTGSADVHV